MVQKILSDCPDTLRPTQARTLQKEVKNLRKSRSTTPKTQARKLPTSSRKSLNSDQGRKNSWLPTARCKTGQSSLTPGPDVQDWPQVPDPLAPDLRFICVTK